MSVPAALLGRHDVATPDEMNVLGRRLGAALAAGDLLVLTGPLGAGKTTLTRGIAAGLGVRGPIQSPTFVIARTHPSLVGGPPLVHADAYRLGSALELDDLDIDSDASVVVVEWGRGMADGLRESWWEVELERPIGGRVADPVNGDPDGSGGDVRGGDVGGDVREGGAGGDVREGDAGGDGGEGTALEDHARDGDALDADAPRVVTISRRP